MLDVIIVGGGPAGLSAALVLGRCRRRVLVCDSGRPRNAASHAMHGYLTRDGISPAEFLKIARQQLCRYDSVETCPSEVVAAAREGEGFKVTLNNGLWFTCRKLLLATGIVDEIPAIEGIEEFYGHSAHHCPYCDGWEVRDQPLAVHGRGEKGRDLALELMLWSRDLVLCTDGEVLSAADRDMLARHGIAVREEQIARLEGRDGNLEHLVFINGEKLARRALFFSSRQYQPSGLAASLGCRVNKKHQIEVDQTGAVGMPGLYVAGDASWDVQLVILAAAEGAAAACAINKALMHEECERNTPHQKEGKK